VFNSQAVDRNDRIQRATMLINIMLHHCDNVQFSEFCGSLIAVGQQRIVDRYLRRNEAGMQDTIFLHHFCITFRGLSPKLRFKNGKFGFFDVGSELSESVQ